MSHSPQPESGSPTSSSPMPPYAPGSPAQPRSNKTLMIVLIVVAMILVGLGAYFFGANSGNKNADGDATEQTSQSGGPSEEQSQGEGDASGETTDGTDGTSQGAGEGETGEATGEEPAPLAPVEPELAQMIDGLHRLDPDDPYALGDVDATIVIEMYSDYR